jgi:hypothetical protein
MMPAAIRKRIGTTSVLSSIMGRIGEFAVDTTKKTLVVFDGINTGGFPLALETHIHPVATESTPGFLSAADKTALDGLITSAGGSATPQTPSNVANALVQRDGFGGFSAGTITATLNGQAASVVNGVVTSGAYVNPSWILSLNAAKLTGTLTINVPWALITGAPTIPTFVSQLINDSHYIISSDSITGSSGSIVGQTSGPSASAVVVRDAAGRAQVAAPLVNADIATKSYVDAAAGGGNNKTIFSTPGSYTWTVPSTVNYVSVVIIGAGGPGSGSLYGTYAGGGGGGGLMAYFEKVRVDPGSSVNVIIGLGGIANTSSPSSDNPFGETRGTAGGVSSFGSLSMAGGNSPLGPNAFGNPGGGGTIQVPTYLGNSFIYPGTFGFASAFDNVTLSGGGGCAGLAVSLISTTFLHGSTSASSPNTGATPDYITKILGAGNGGTVLIPPGAGGGGSGAAGIGTPGYNAGQNGGPGLVIIFW